MRGLAYACWQALKPNMNWGQGRWGQRRWGQGWWGRGSGRKLKWAPIVSDRSCGSVDPQSFEEDEFPAPELQCAPPPESLGEHDFPDADRSCGSSGADDRGRSEHHSGGASSSGAHAREPSAGSERSVFTEAPGDSEATDEETSAVAEHDAEDAQSAAAEAEFEDGRPPRRAKGRSTTPRAVAGRPLRNATFTDRPDVGNAGLFYGNWGRRTKQMGGEVQRNIDDQIKKNAQIIGLSECEQVTEDLLIGDPQCAAEGKDPAVAGAKQKKFRGTSRPRLLDPKGK